MKNVDENKNMTKKKSKNRIELLNQTIMKKNQIVTYSLRSELS